MQSRARRRAVAILITCVLCATGALAQLTIGDKSVKKVVGKVAVKPKALKFGKVTHSATLQFNIQNSGTAPISGSIGSTGNTAFTIIGGSASFGPLNPGDAYSVTVQFAPAKKGSFKSAITIASNARNAKVKVAMSGSAQAALATATPSPSPTPAPTPTPSPSPSPRRHRSQLLQSDCRAASAVRM